MKRVPHNGYLEVWLQRIVKPRAVGIPLESDEPICKIVNGEPKQLWECNWISHDALKQAIDVERIVVKKAADAEEVIQPEEVALFTQNAWMY